MPRRRRWAKAVEAEVEFVELRGTQVGSEGVKAPTSTADDQMKYYLEQAWPVTGDARSGAHNLRGEAIDIIP